ADRLSRGSLHPRIESSAQGLALVLNGKVDQGRRATESRSPRASFKVVGAGRAAEGHVEMRVHINASGKDVLLAGVDDLSCTLARKLCSEGLDLDAGNSDVARISIGRRNHTAINDKSIEAHCKRPPGKRRMGILC